MSTAETAFVRLTDGTLLLRQADGSYRPIASETDRARLAALSDDDIERMATADPDHPSLDGAFWAGVDSRPGAQDATSIKLDNDLLSYFRRAGTDYQSRINAILRRYVDAHEEGRN